jgi:hypothetical protein
MDLSYSLWDLSPGRDSLSTENGARSEFMRLPCYSGDYSTHELKSMVAPPPCKSCKSSPLSNKLDTFYLCLSCGICQCSRCLLNTEQTKLTDSSVVEDDFQSSLWDSPEPQLSSQPQNLECIFCGVRKLNDVWNIF